LGWFDSEQRGASGDATIAYYRINRWRRPLVPFARLFVLHLQSERSSLKERHLQIEEGAQECMDGKRRKSRKF